MPNVTPPPVPTQVAVTDSSGLATRAWIAWFTTLGKLFGYNQTIQSNGTPLPQEVALNFTGFVVKDDPTNGATVISPAAAAFSVQFGSAEVNATGGDYATVDVVFPTKFGSVPKVVASATSFPRGANTPMTCIVSAVTEEGFTLSLACAVPTGGGGATVDLQTSCDWIAIA